MNREPRGRIIDGRTEEGKMRQEREAWRDWNEGEQWRDDNWVIWKRTEAAQAVNKKKAEAIMVSGRHPGRRQIPRAVPPPKKMLEED
jgi:hypothetical protein